MDDRYKQVHAAVARLLTSVGKDWEHDANFKETPRRVASWLLEKFPSEAELTVKRGQYAEAVFPSTYDGVVTQTGILVWSLCPHHLIPVEYRVSIGYLAHGYKIGLSKLARFAELELGRAGLQEDLTQQLTETLIVSLHTEDVAVVVRGKHHCMCARGVRQQAAVTTTSEMRGKFRQTHSNLRHEFLSLVNGGVK